MPRVARIVVADVAHHITQRGNGRQYILATDAERAVYLDLLRQGLRKHRETRDRLSLVFGFCPGRQRGCMLFAV
jgi:hypothetical protein